MGSIVPEGYDDAVTRALQGRDGPVRSRSALRELVQVLVEAVPSLGGAFLHPGLEEGVALLDRVELRGGRERGLAVMLLEDVGLGPRFALHALEPERPHEPLGSDDLAVLTEERRSVVGPPFGAPVHDPPRAARPEVDLALHDLVVPRSPPVRHVLARAVR